MAFSFVLMIVLWMCTTLIVWVFMLGVVITLVAYGSYLIYGMYSQGALNDGLNTVRVYNINYKMTSKNEIWFVAVLCILLGLIFLIIMIKKGGVISKTTPLISAAIKSSLRNVLLWFTSVLIIAL